MRPTKGIPTPAKQVKPAKNEVDGAVALIEALGRDWDPANYRDEYEKRLKRVIKRKQKGQTVKTPERQDEPSPVPDLMAALEQTLAEIKDGKRPVPA